MKRCGKCKLQKEAVAFARNKNSKDGRQSMCRSCLRVCNADNRARNPERAKASERLRLYGVSAEQYAALLAQHDQCCHLCREPLRTGRWVHIDHDHETRVVRGVLCRPCNVALGTLGDNEAGLLRALAYLRGEA